MYAIFAGMLLTASAANAQCYPVKKTADVTYSTVYNLTMDIYTPIGSPATKRPVLIMAHGGSFSGGSKAENTSTEIARRFASRGYTTASINYRLESSTLNLTDSNVAAGAVMRAVGDMKAAVRFFRKDAAGANLYLADTNTVYVGGNSAGAITAVNLAYLNDSLEAPVYIRSQIATNGGVDGNSGNPGYSSKVSGVLNFAGGVKDTFWINAGEPKVFSAHGDADKTVPYDYDNVLNALTGNGALATTITLFGSGAMKPRLDKVGVTNVLKTYVGADHVPWESDVNIFKEIDSLSAVFLGAPTCFELGLSTGIEEVEASQISLYPNPANNVLNITAETPIRTIRIVDQLGREVETKNVAATTTTISVANFSKGIYVANLQMQSGANITKKFVVE